ncbi:MAG: holo-ACP synthase [Candidatus Marinimicrobia bacterium]|nr:holo-ACP synthase [Candidatus Neomarinimicrobiota bacterium]MCH7763458.1 holo-ACP synthase [Candidatus Neomarinimicrobiota bacterium]
MPPDVYIGTDIVDIARIRELMNSHPDRFISKTYTPKEQSYCQEKANPEIHFAGRFAAKEAIKKALMTSGINDPIRWTDIEIIADKNGAPNINLNGARFNTLQCKVSISHTNETAIAFAVVIKE